MEHCNSDEVRVVVVWSIAMHSDEVRVVVV